ncbi:hypothetical protein P2G88_16935 [Aliiglaciecola sp. CAU 1673]|uniref:hypothetical protein n=1 Tax=Aliiglaciecola sp. CAU 1673 TaxID=3032595 RepID=UPI0023DB2789|nr:hypothetical protein [Aliiglaciecola sp. CAU 1673]MDF2179941.1 hypothetical protein [Aliiglaciecola sp. CAU 1673]
MNMACILGHSRRGSRSTLAALCNVLALALISAAYAEGVQIPDCPALTDWAKALDPAQTVSLTQSVNFPSVFSDVQVEPLFGVGMISWNAKELSDTRRAINLCRKQASKQKRKEDADQLYAMMKALDGIRRDLTDIQRMRQTLNQQVDWLTNMRGDARLISQLTVARDSLLGTAKPLEEYGLAQRPNWLGTFEQAPKLLPEKDIAPYQQRLTDKIQQLDSEQSAIQTAYQQAKQELDALPLSTDSFAKLDSLGKATFIRELPPQQADDFVRAVNDKRYLINRTIAAEEAAIKEAEANRPAAVKARLDALLQGDSVANIGLGGLAPGQSYAQAKQILEQQWGFKTGAGGDLLKEFSPTLKALNHFVDTEQRDGGRVELDTMHGQLGRFVYFENFTGPMDMAEAYKWLVERLGEPVSRGTDLISVTASWHQDERYLDVKMGNGAIGPRSSKVFQSFIIMAIWSQSFADYLQEAKERCQALMDKPASELSINEKQALLMGCKTP